MTAFYSFSKLQEKPRINFDKIYNQGSRKIMLKISFEISLGFFFKSIN